MPRTRRLRAAISRPAADFYPVDLRDDTGLVDQPRECPVVGQEDESLGGKVEPAHGVDAGSDPGSYEIQHRLAPFRIANRRNDVTRLVEQHVDRPLRTLNAGVVDLDGITSGVRLGAELGNDAPVDRHTPLGDEVFRLPPGCNAGVGQNLLQALAHRCWG